MVVLKSDDRRLIMTKEENGTVDISLKIDSNAGRKFFNELIFEREGNERIFDIFALAYDKLLYLFLDFCQKHPEYTASIVYKNKYFLPPIFHRLMNLYSPETEAIIMALGLTYPSDNHESQIGIVNYDNKYFGIFLNQLTGIVRQNRQDAIIKKDTKIKEIYDIYDELFTALENNKEPVKTYCLRAPDESLKRHLI